MSTDGSSSVSSTSPHVHDVCCVGTALIDHLAFAGLDVVSSLGLDAGTMTLIDGATAARVRAAVGEGADVSGGTVANTATGVASLGGRPVYVGAVADDDLGTRYGEDLEQAGVRAVLERLPLADGGTTGTGACYVIVTPDAERTMATTLGVSGLLHASALDASSVAAADLVYFDGYLLDFPDAEGIIDRIVELAKPARGPMSHSDSPTRFVVERHHDRLAELINRVNVVFSNEDEAMNMTGESTPGVRSMRCAAGAARRRHARCRGAPRPGQRGRRGPGKRGRAGRRRDRRGGPVCRRRLLRPHARARPHQAGPAWRAVRRRGDRPPRGAPGAVDLAAAASPRIWRLRRSGWIPRASI